MSTNELEMKIRELRQLQQLIEEAQAEAEGIRDAIKCSLDQFDKFNPFDYPSLSNKPQKAKGQISQLA